VAAVATGGVLLARRRRRRGSAPSPELARLARLADGLTPLRSALLGFALVALSVRQWLFLVPAAGFFSAAAVAGGRAWLPVLGAVVASLGVAVPVVVASWAQATEPVYLRRARRWWMREGDTVGAAVAVAVGGALLTVGLLRL
jgi:formate-dependent nitrite reductase membrane component NrfD